MSKCITRIHKNRCYNYNKIKYMHLWISFGIYCIFCWQIGTSAESKGIVTMYFVIVFTCGYIPDQRWQLGSPILCHRMAPGKTIGVWNIIFAYIFITETKLLQLSMNWYTSRGSYWQYVNIGSGNSMVPSGKKPSSDQIFSEIYDDIWRD